LQEGSAYTVTAFALISGAVSTYAAVGASAGRIEPKTMKKADG